MLDKQAGGSSSAGAEVSWMSEPPLKLFVELMEEFAGEANLEQLRHLLESVARIYLGEKTRLTLSRRKPSPEALPLLGYDGKRLGWLKPGHTDHPGAPTLAAVAGLLLDWGPSPAPVGELIAARNVLRQMLPHGELRSPPYHVHGWLQPAHFVGGDCFDFLQRDNQLCFLLADAVGHGLASTMMALECRALWRAFCRTEDGDRIALLLNGLLSQDERSDEQFVAACIGNLDTATGTLTYTCCGLAPCFLQSRKKGVRVDSLADPPLGVFGNTPYTPRTIVLRPGDRAVFVTDGVIERANNAGKNFGEQRLAQLLRDTAGEPPDLALERLKASLDQFAEGADPSDDAAALMVWREP